jgi:hypothetical protein
MIVNPPLLRQLLQNMINRGLQQVAPALQMPTAETGEISAHPRLARK